MNIEFFDTIKSFIFTQHLLTCCLIVCSTFGLHVLEAKCFRSLQTSFKQKNQSWSLDSLGAIHKPLRIMIWFLGLFYLLRTVLEPAIFSPFILGKKIGVIVIFSWFLLRFAHCLDEKAKYSAMDKTAVQALGHLLRVVIIVVAILLILHALNINLTALLAFGGAGSLIIGLASKDLLSNFFGALILFIDKPFKVGELIRSSDKNIEGIVEYIGWRLTRIRTANKSSLYVPNSLFSTILVENASRLTHRRIHETFGIQYKDFAKIANMTKELVEMLKQYAEVDQNMPLSVHLATFTPYYIECVIQAFAKTTDLARFQILKQEILLKAMHIVHQQEIPVALQSINQ